VPRGENALTCRRLTGSSYFLSTDNSISCWVPLLPSCRHQSRTVLYRSTLPSPKFSVSVLNPHVAHLWLLAKCPGRASPLTVRPEALPALYMRSLSVRGPPVVITTDGNVGDWVRTFHNVVRMCFESFILGKLPRPHRPSYTQ